MSHSVRPTQLADLKELWRQWTAIVDRLAHRRRGGARISRGGYRALHATLLEACDAPMAASDAMSADVPKRLGEIAQPWVTLESLKDSNQQILKSLLDRCLDAERNLLGRSRRLVNLQKLISVCLLLAAVIIAIVHINGTQIDGSKLGSVGGELHSLWTQLVYAIRFSSFLERFSFVTIIVVVVAIILGTQTVKRWS
ncbi:MAG: hypothetical protein WD648_12270 [Planctomycetaceae bacterium]